MNGRTFAAVLLVIVLGIGATILGITSYNAGVTAGLAQNVAQASGDVILAPGYPGSPYVGWGYGGWGNGGWGFFGFFAALLFFFLVFGLIRAAFGMGRGWGRGGWGPGGPGRGGDHRHGYGAWDERVREVHDELHRSGNQPPSSGAPQPGA